MDTTIERGRTVVRLTLFFGLMLLVSVLLMALMC